MTVMRVTLIGVLLLAAAPLARGGELVAHETKHYVIHTDLPAGEVREAAVRVTKMAEGYFAQLPGVAARRAGVRRLPFYLYNDPSDYRKAGGAENSAGYFDGERLMALTLRRPDGQISLSTWNVVQHEGFHQLAQEAFGGRLPMWADEGLAEYFGEGIFTGDGFETGLVSQARLGRVREMLREGREAPLREFRGIAREAWNRKIDLRNYDQAWSLVHFLMHGEGGRFRPALGEYLKDVAAGDEPETAYNRYLNAIPDLEGRWRAWWLAVPDYPTQLGYGRATLAIMTSFLARAEAAGQRLESFEALVKTPSEALRQPEADWLPPSLFVMAAAESAKLRRRGETFSLVRQQGGAGVVLTMTDGAKVVGRYEVKAGRVARVWTEVVEAGKPVTRPATTRAVGEMLR
jgi:hypothetical protein